MTQRKPGDYVVNAELTDEQRDQFVQDCVAAGALDDEARYSEHEFTSYYVSGIGRGMAGTTIFAGRGGTEKNHTYPDNVTESYKANPTLQLDLVRQIADAMERNPDGWWREFEYQHGDGPGDWGTCEGPDVALVQLLHSNLRPRPRTYTLHIEGVPEPMRDEPEYGSDYWIVSIGKHSFTPAVGYWTGKEIDLSRLHRGLCYPDKESAQQAMEKLKAAMGVRDE